MGIVVSRRNARATDYIQTIYIYSLYIWSPVFSITRKSHGSKVPSGSAAPGVDGYKKTPRPPGIRF